MAIRVSVGDKQYQLKKIKSSDLLRLGFRKDYDNDEGCNYSKRFIAYINNETATLWGVINIDPKSRVVIDIMNSDGGYYRPYYYSDYGDYKPLIDKINESITSNLKKLGIFKEVIIYENKTKSRRIS